MVGSGAAIAADLLAVSVLISITRQLWDTRVAKKAKRTLQVRSCARIDNTANVCKTSVLHDLYIILADHWPLEAGDGCGAGPVGGGADEGVLDAESPAARRASERPGALIALQAREGVGGAAAAGWLGAR